eukprot:Em0161g1a
MTLFFTTDDNMDTPSLMVVILHFHLIESSTQSLPCHTDSGDNCTSSICPNTVVTYICTITSGTAAGYTDWTLPTGTCPSNSFPNKIRLSQLVTGLCSPQGTGVPSMCGPYRASSIQSSDPTYCLSSILTVNITAAMNVPPGPVRITAWAPPVTSPPDQLTVTWTPPTTGGVPTSYTVTINDSSSPVVMAANGSPVYTHTFTGLVSDTLYTVSVVAINCAGASNGTSETTSTYTSINGSVINDASYDTRMMVVRCSLNQSFYCVVCCSTDPSVPPDSSVYNISTTRGTEVTVSLQGLTSGQMYYCKAAATNTNSNNCAGPMVGGVFNFTFRLPHSDVTTPTVPDTSINGSAINDSSYDTRMMVVRCSFNQSFYCVSTDPSVPPDSSLYNISTTRGTEVTVSLQGLTSYQIYYCKAAATSTRSNNCTGVKVFFSFMTYSIPQSNLSNPGTSSHLPSIDVSTVVGITFSITFIMAFSLGVLVTICISCISKTKSKTTSSHPTTSNAPYDVVGIRQKKIDTIELKSNDAYGTVK